MEAPNNHGQSDLATAHHLTIHATGSWRLSTAQGGHRHAPPPPLQAAGNFPRTRTKGALHHFASLILTRVQTPLSNSFHFSTTSQVFKQAVLRGRKKTSKLYFTQLLSHLNILRCFLWLLLVLFYLFIYCCFTC